MSENDRIDYGDKSDGPAQLRPDIQLNPEDRSILEKTASAGSDTAMKNVPTPGDIFAFAGTDVWSKESKDSFVNQRTFGNSFKSALREIKANLPF